MLPAFVYRWSLYVEPFTECPSERLSECFVLTVRVASIYLQVVAACGTFRGMSLQKTFGMFRVSCACCLHLFISGRCMWNLSQNVPQKDPRNVSCYRYVLSPFIYRWSLHVKPFDECPSERPSECFMLTVRVASIYLQVVAICGTFHGMSLGKTLEMFRVSGA